MPTSLGSIYTPPPTTAATTELPTFTSPPPPTPTFGVAYSTPDGSITITVGQPSAAIIDPDTDNTQYVVVALPVKVVTGSTPIDYGDTFLAVGPSTYPGAENLDGFSQIAELKSDGPATRTSATIKAACGATPLLGDRIAALPQDPTTAAFELTIPPSTTVAGCIPTELRATDRPTTVRVFTDALVAGSSEPSASFDGLKAPAARPPIQPTTLGTWSGSGSDLIHVEPAVASGTDKVCWNMPNNGLNSIVLQDDTAGAGYELLTNVVGSVSDCRFGALKEYMQVLSNGSWTITATNF